MSFEIVKLNSWESGVDYTHITFHHSATTDNETLKDYNAIKQYHIETRGWRDIGYNVVIEKVNGIWVALWGRPLGMSGAHCSENKRNYNSVGICVVGNYQVDQFDYSATSLIKEVVNALEKELGTLVIDQHKDNSSTSCAGQYFPTNDTIRIFCSVDNIVDSVDNFYESKLIAIKDFIVEALDYGV